MTSQSPEFQFLLDAYGVDYMDLLTADSSFVRDIGAQDSYFGELSLGYTLNEKIKAFGILGHATQAIPEHYHTPGSFDFDTTQIRGVVSYLINNNVGLHFNADYFYRPQVTVTDSVFGLTNDLSTGTSGLPGEGRYHMSLMRAGITTIFQL